MSLTDEIKPRPIEIAYLDRKRVEILDRYDWKQACRIRCADGVEKIVDGATLELVNGNTKPKTRAQVAAEKYDAEIAAFVTEYNVLKAGGEPINPEWLKDLCDQFGWRGYPPSIIASKLRAARNRGLIE
ncbi:MAG: hypothetical protein RLZZ182_1501 [Pseudomonadota bacterium]